MTFHCLFFHAVSASTGVISGSCIRRHLYTGLHCTILHLLCLRGEICTLSNCEYTPCTTVAATPRAMYTKNTNDTRVTDENETCNIGYCSLSYTAPCINNRNIQWNILVLMCINQIVQWNILLSIICHKQDKDMLNILLNNNIHYSKATLHTDCYCLLYYYETF